MPTPATDRVTCQALTTERAAVEAARDARGREPGAFADARLSAAISHLLSVEAAHRASTGCPAHH